MTPPDTPLAALPAAVPPKLRAAGRALPARAHGRRRLRAWMGLLSLLLHLALLCALLFAHRRLREAAVAPSFQVLFQPPGANIGKSAATKPSELPAPALPPAPAPPPPTQAVPPPSTPMPPTPMPPTPMPPPAAALPRAVAPTPPPPVPTAPSLPQSSLPESSLPRPAAPALPQTLPAPTTQAVPAAPPSPAPPALAMPPSTAPPASSVKLAPAVPLPAPPAPARPAPAETPQVRLSLAPPEFAPPVLQTPAPTQPAPRPTPRRRRSAFPLPIDTSLGIAAAPSPSRRTQRGTGAIDLALGRATRDSPGAPPRDTNAESGDLVVHGAQVGKDWEELLHEWWLRHGYYPEEAARRGEDGRVSIHVRVDRYGHVQQVELENSSGSQWLDMGAQATFRGATLPPFPPSTPEPTADLDITIRYILVPR